MSGLAPRALEDSVRPRRLVGASWRPLNFAVRGLFMTLQRKVVVAAISSFIVGGLVVGTLAYVGFSRYVEYGTASGYYASAVEAQFAVRTLSRLRSGNIDKVMSDFDLLLDSNTIHLAEYENVVPPARRQLFVYQTLAEVRDYRAKFPTHFEYPLQEAEFEKALALGKKAGG